MTVYENLIEQAEANDRIISGLMVDLQNAPYKTYIYPSTAEIHKKILGDEIDIFSTRARALRTAAMHLPIEVAESEV